MYTKKHITYHSGESKSWFVGAEAAAQWLRLADQNSTQTKKQQYSLALEGSNLVVHT